MPLQRPRRSWLAMALTVALALTLELTGALHVYGLSALAGGRLALGAGALLALLALGWAAVPAARPAASDAPDWSVRLIALLMLLAWAATARDFAVFLAPGAPLLQPLAFWLGGLPLLAALVRPPRGVALLGLAVALGSAARLAGFAAVPIEPTRGDMLPLVQGALENLLAGSSPYTTYRMPWELPLTYLPLTWLAYLPPRLLGLDIRLTNLLAELTVGAALLWIASTSLTKNQGRRTKEEEPTTNDQQRTTDDRRPTRTVFGSSAPLPVLLWGWTFLLPTAQHWSHATTAPVTWALLAVTLALVARGRDRAGALALGLFAAASPLASVAALFVGVRWLRAYGLKQALRLSALALLVALALVAPFLAWSPEQFVFGAFRWFNDNSLFPRLRWEMDNTWASMVGFSGAFWRRGLEGLLKPIQAAMLLALLALFWRRGAEARQLGPLLTAAFLLFTVFNPVLWPYLYNPALIAALVATAVLVGGRRSGIGGWGSAVGGEESKRAETLGIQNVAFSVLPSAFYLQPSAFCLQPSAFLQRSFRTALVLALLPMLVVPGPTRPNASAAYDPATERLLLRHGYAANITRVGGRWGLRASQRSYPNSVWARDLDYAISGFALALGDVKVLRSSVELLLEATGPDGVAPETIYLDRGYAENRQSWDSMPNLVHAAYVYVAKTGDRRFYLRHRDQLLLLGGWIAALDADGDGLPDRDVFPFGYYDSVEGGVMHTYALAKFYAAFRELAELERFTGLDGAVWDQRADRLRSGYHLPVEQGGYWLDTQPWPIAWRRADGHVEPLLETFGVFEALRAGLIGPADGARYRQLVDALHGLLPALTDGAAPLKLALGGYPPEVLRQVDPPVPRWMLDASAPWVVGLAAPAYAQAGYAGDAAALLRAFRTMAHTTDPPVLEFVASAQARYGAGQSADGGRAWDSAAWFMAVYGGHYGLALKPSALQVEPCPFEAIPSDRAGPISYQGAQVQIELDAGRGVYALSASKPVAARLLPICGAALLQLDGGRPQPSATLTLQPGRTYRVQSVTAPRDAV